jgi:putative NIF3 family GTP cyclohydrolase 1 type 2
MKLLPLALPALLAGALLAQSSHPTAQQIIERIQKNVGVPWTTPTVDTFKAGDPQTPVTGVAVTMMATMDVIERAAAAGKNLVITHEPTFYSHQDKTDALEAQHDAVWAEKEAFIRDHHMVVWRFHDHWHQRHPDGILEGMTNALGWKKFQSAEAPYLFTLPQTTLNDLAEQTKQKLAVAVERVVGDPGMKLTHVAMIPGAAGSPRQIQALERDDVEALVIGETPEWETVEYVADATTEHKHKGLIILGHIPSEQAGMKECADWLKGFVTEVPVEFIPAQQPFWMPH